MKESAYSMESTIEDFARDLRKLKKDKEDLGRAKADMQSRLQAEVITPRSQVIQLRALFSESCGSTTSQDWVADLAAEVREKDGKIQMLLALDENHRDQLDQLSHELAAAQEREAALVQRLQVSDTQTIDRQHASETLLVKEQEIIELMGDLDAANSQLGAARDEILRLRRVLVESEVAPPMEEESSDVRPSRDSAASSSTTCSSPRSQGESAISTAASAMESHAVGAFPEAAAAGPSSEAAPRLGAAKAQTPRVAVDPSELEQRLRARRVSNGDSEPQVLGVTDLQKRRLERDRELQEVRAARKSLER